MRYSRSGDDWTPEPFHKRIASAGSGLLIPPLFMGLFAGVGAFAARLFGILFWHSPNKFLTWSFNSWGDWYWLTSVAFLLVILEIRIIDGDTYSLDDMVLIRLGDLEENARRSENILP